MEAKHRDRRLAGLVKPPGDESAVARDLVLARRLVEARLPVVTLFFDYDGNAGCTGGGWDTHWNAFGCLKDFLLPEFDRAYSALPDDLH